MRRQTVILANGDFPRRGGEARRILAAAARVICCDGAANAYRRWMRCEPYAVVGDGDSFKGRFTNVIRDAEQETNDLEKAIRWCRAQGWEKPVILGATGKREDHTIGNVFRALRLGVEIVTDFGRFVPFEGRGCFAARKGQSVSVFAPDPSTRMTSCGLQWSLQGVRFRNLFCATLNRATARRIELTATKPVILYFAQ